MKFKVNDVYSFRYYEEEARKRFEPYHCFDGQFIVKQGNSGKLYLMDTYWASKHDGFKHWSDYKVKSIEDAQKEGTLTFKCNLSEVEEISDYDLRYYSDDDVFNLSYQHGCYKFFVKRKGAERSKEKMLQTIKQKLHDAEYSRKLAESNIDTFSKILKQIEEGDLKVYL